MVQQAPTAHWCTVGYFEWIGTFRNLSYLSAVVKNVGAYLANHADYETGKNAHPGLALLMLETGYGSKQTVINALDTLRKDRLVMRTFEGSSAGRRGLADVYQLALTNQHRDVAGKDPCSAKHDATVQALTPDEALASKAAAEARIDASKAAARAAVNGARGPGKEADPWDF